MGLTGQATALPDYGMRDHDP